MDIQSVIDYGSGQCTICLHFIVKFNKRVNIAILHAGIASDKCKHDCMYQIAVYYHVWIIIHRALYKVRNGY